MTALHATLAASFASLHGRDVPSALDEELADIQVEVMRAVLSSRAWQDFRRAVLRADPALLALPVEELNALEELRGEVTRAP
ncbi:hypothetical protein BST28_17465 [Mycolicibacter kumamotonensis]|uniref:Uncharacterized protein n=1 Tax=Mycolicibacter kumamotonensis TaxID=354243 RepID=A0A1X0DZ83_9MYCO|nr:hypothetical protein [Mycolicibacter kumamotonensis]ORA77591.1 hypothetical protein BST28_17465 [Mycolicibacter kumamotonensis]